MQGFRIGSKLGASEADPPDMRAYLAMAHNHGLGFCRATIAQHGLD